MKPPKNDHKRVHRDSHDEYVKELDEYDRNSSWIDMPHSQPKTDEPYKTQNGENRGVARLFGDAK